MIQRIKDSIKILIGRSKAIPAEKYAKTENYCPVCEKRNAVFNPLPFYYFRQLDKNQFIHSIFQGETLNLEFYSCYNCGASDRDRLYALYINRFLRDKIKKNNIYSLLDIAPAKALTKYLKHIPQLKVRTADLFMEDVDDKVDITDMKEYTDESFDIFICSHVLEHIEDDIKAMMELYRVTKKGGWGIAMVPINLGLLDNYENKNVLSIEDRWKYFGQDDHVRMYSKHGFIKRLTSVGFTVNEFNIEFFGEDVFKKNGIHPRSVLYIVNK